MILVILGIIILLYGFINYKKAFMLYLAYQIFWYGSAALIKLGGRTLQIQLALTVGFFCLFLFKNKKLARPNKKVPYRIPMIMTCLSCFATCFTSLDGFISEAIVSLSATISMNVILIWLIWYSIETKEDFRYLFRLITVVMIAACLFGLFEYLTNSNIILDYKNAYSSNAIGNYNSSAYNFARRGYRIYSFFEHPIGAGMTFGLYSAFTLILIIKNKEKLPLHRLALLTALLCLPCVFLTKMRSAMIFTFIACLACIDFKKKKFYGIILLVVIVIVAAWPYINQYSYILLSLFDSSMESSAGGSSLSMRLEQVVAVINIWKLSPIAGLGYNFEEYLSESITSGGLGYESVWFLQTARYGLIGIIATIVDIVYSVIIIPRKFHSREIFFISLAYWITYTVTSIPSFRISLYYLALFYFIKSSEKYKNSHETIHLKSFKLRI